MSADNTGEKTGLPILKMLNPRIFLFISVMTVMAAFCAYRFFNSGADPVFYTVIGVGCLAFVFFALHLSNLEEIIIFLIAVVFSVSACGIGASMKSKNRTDGAVNDTIAQLTCVLDTPFSVVRGTETECVVYVPDGQAIAGGKWTLRLTDTEFLPLDAALGATFELKDVVAYAGTESDLSAKDETTRTLTASYRSAIIKEQRGGLPFSRVRYACINAMRKGMSAKNAAIAAALIFGDRSMLAPDDYDVFRYAGLAHAMAVSGLHIGFLMAMINFLLSRVRRFRFPCFIAAFSVTVFYAIICGGSVSVIRAVIMGLLSFAANLVGKRSDPINNISIAAISILIVSPVSVASMSFILSFLSVFSILILSPIFERMLRKCKIPRKIASPVSVTISATIGILPITAASFHTVNLWSVLVNFVALPLVELAFILTVTLLLIALVAPAVLVIPGGVLIALFEVARFFSGLPGADLVLFPFGAAGSILYFSALFLIGGLVLYRYKLFRIIGKSVSLGVMIAVVVLCSAPKHYRGTNVAALGYYTPAAVVTTESGCVVAGNAEVLSEADRFLSTHEIRKVNVLVITKFSNDSHDALKRFCKRFSVENLVFDYDPETLYEYGSYKDPFVLIDEPLSFGEFTVRSDLKKRSVEIETGSKRLILCIGKYDWEGYADCVVSETPVASKMTDCNLVLRDAGESYVYLKSKDFIALV